ncbi:MAG: hypothetical protein N3B15_04195 [Planctomycetota bacterium]|nr:hypothetical protein [Planctomycetota bacterium]
MQAAIALLIFWASAGAAEPLPPSPGLVAGVRRVEPPAFARWPALVDPDEPVAAGLAIALPLTQAAPEASVSWHWPGEPAVAVPLAGAGAQLQAMVRVPKAAGRHTLRVQLGEAAYDLPLRMVPASEPWPHAALRAGCPVDAAGAPVLLVTPRATAMQDRRWAWLRPRPRRPEGRPLLVGDPLAAWGRTAWEGLAAEQRALAPERSITAATLVALAQLPTPLPRTIVWSPGNAPLADGDWDPSESRLMLALSARLRALQAAPRLVLALPPWPLSEAARALAEQRRRTLAAVARSSGWRIIDLARAAGPPESAQRVGERAYAPYPVGAAQDRMRALLAGELADDD